MSLFADQVVIRSTYHPLQLSKTMPSPAMAEFDKCLCPPAPETRPKSPKIPPFQQWTQKCNNAAKDASFFFLPYKEAECSCTGIFFFYYYYSLKLSWSPPYFFFIIWPTCRSWWMPSHSKIKSGREGVQYPMEGIFNFRNVALCVITPFWTTARD